MEQYIAPV